MVAGKPLAHVYSDHSPDADFDSIQGDLEDVFFTHIKGFRNQ